MIKQKSKKDNKPTKSKTETKENGIIGHIIYSSPGKDMFKVFFSVQHGLVYNVGIGNEVFMERTLSRDTANILYKIGCHMQSNLKDYARSRPKINGIRVKTFFDPIENEIDVRFNADDDDELYRIKHAIIDYVYRLTKVKGEETTYERIHDCKNGAGK